MIEPAPRDAGDDPPDVSVVLLTYNHERFVEQAIESVLAQRGVTFELLIAEDCSTDGTRRIVEDVARRHPHRVRLFLSPRNLNTNDVLAHPIAAARGRFVALLDGDDYWTSPHKLRRQVAFLDARPEFAICFHNVTVVYEDGTPPHPFHSPTHAGRVWRAVPPERSTLADVASANFMQTCSVMFRQGLFAFPPWYADFVVGDWPLHVLNAEHGDIGYIDETLAVYRVHAGGLWSAQMSRHARREWVDALARGYHTLDAHLERRFTRELQRQVTALYLAAAVTACEQGRLRDARYFARRYRARFPLHQRITPGPLMRATLRAVRRALARRIARSPRRRAAAP